VNEYLREAARPGQGVWIGSISRDGPAERGGDYRDVKEMSGKKGARKFMVASDEMLSLVQEKGCEASASVRKRVKLSSSLVS
jgi:hypothetical protein